MRRTLTNEEFKSILDKHSEWLKDSTKGKQACLADINLIDSDLINVNLSRAELRNIDLHYSDLDCVNMSGARLHSTDLSQTYLGHANLNGATLINVNLSHADLSNATLIDATLENVNFYDADLSSANFYGAHITNTNFKNVSISSDTIGIAPMCPMEGSFIAYKKAQDRIIVLEIPADARRSSSTAYKCRCDKAKVLRIENLDGSPCDDLSVNSDYDADFIYTIGKTVFVDNFDTCRWNICSTGIHFFISRDMAVNYEN